MCLLIFIKTNYIWMFADVRIATHRKGRERKKSIETVTNQNGHELRSYVKVRKFRWISLESIHLYMAKAKRALHTLQNDIAMYNEELNENDRKEDKIIKQWIRNKWRKKVWKIFYSCLRFPLWFLLHFCLRALFFVVELKAIAVWH